MCFNEVISCWWLVSHWHAFRYQQNNSSHWNSILWQLVSPTRRSFFFFFLAVNWRLALGKFFTWRNHIGIDLACLTAALTPGEISAAACAHNFLLFYKTLQRVNDSKVCKLIEILESFHHHRRLSLSAKCFHEIRSPNNRTCFAFPQDPGKGREATPWQPS